MKRYPASILCTCVVPWDENGEFLEGLFVDEVQRMLKTTRHLYIFGTAGEGHVVSNRQFKRITQVFHDTMAAAGAEAMVGVISLSLPTIIERIELAREMGVRQFQISLPSWGALTDDEVRTFFQAVCGGFRDCQFLHYNLMRTKRLIAPELYAELAEKHPNFVGTKNCTDSMDRLRGLMTLSPQLQHFPGEVGYIYASQLGECGLLASLASNATALHEFFDAGRRSDLPRLLERYAEIAAIFQELIAAVGPNAHIDSAYDKVLWKLQDERFPLRLLPPYVGATDAAFQRFAEFVRTKCPRWTPEPT
ncbi:MAG: dihydrodipicolinate synthase family protein [Planctomycetales bacterium]|nr:dihydrodipicolinate synthase family protein [Planctomycetales bacterium]